MGQTGDFDIKKEAAWMVCNLSSGGHGQQIGYAVDCGCIKPLVDLLSISDVKMVGMALEALENILKVGKQHQMEQGLADNPVVALLEQVDTPTRLEALQEDPNEHIYQKA